MTTQVSCPFCGVIIYNEGTPLLYHPKNNICKLGRDEYGMSKESWNLRPPQQEQPAPPPVTSEVEWLRGLVEKIIDDGAPD